MIDSVSKKQKIMIDFVSKNIENIHDFMFLE